MFRSNSLLILNIGKVLTNIVLLTVCWKSSAPEYRMPYMMVLVSTGRSWSIRPRACILISLLYNLCCITQRIYLSPYFTNCTVSHRGHTSLWNGYLRIRSQATSIILFSLLQVYNNKFFKNFLVRIHLKHMHKNITSN